jgi:hypothetical protein
MFFGKPFLRAEKTGQNGRFQMLIDPFTNGNSLGSGLISHGHLTDIVYNEILNVNTYSKRFLRVGHYYKSFGYNNFRRRVNLCYGQYLSIQYLDISSHRDEGKDGGWSQRSK